jgi:hypothetical protein
MTKFWSGLRETRRSSQALFPGKGRRFKSGQPHHKLRALVKKKLVTLGYCLLLLVIFWCCCVSVCFGGLREWHK